MRQKNKIFERVNVFYLFVFALGAVIIAPTHLFPQPYFMPLRFPHYLEMMPTFLGISWPMSFKLYHNVLYSLAAIGGLNVLGIIFYPKFKKTAIASSLIGLFLISLIVLFFFFKFLSVNAPTAVIYGLYSMALLIVNILTLKALIIGEKEA